MDLEQTIRKTKAIYRTPTPQVLKEVEKGHKFIVVEDSFDMSFIPDNYILIDMNHESENFKALIPQSLMYFMANPGEGNIDDALNELSDFYGEAKDHEKDMINDGKTSVNHASWATISKSSYDTYLINKLVRRKGFATDPDGEPVPEFDSNALRNLDVNDSYVSDRLKTMAALALGKDAHLLKSHDVSTVLKHVTIRKKEENTLTKKEFERVTCWAGSHYELKSEFRNDPDTSYNIERYHDRDTMRGTKVTLEKKASFVDTQIDTLEKEISEYRKKKKGPEKISPHDEALLRQYVNLAYITPENSKAKLHIQPPEKTSKETYAKK